MCRRRGGRCKTWREPGRSGRRCDLGGSSKIFNGELLRTKRGKVPCERANCTWGKSENGSVTSGKGLDLRAGHGPVPVSNPVAVVGSVGAATRRRVRGCRRGVGRGTDLETALSGAFPVDVETGQLRIEFTKCWIVHHHLGERELGLERRETAERPKQKNPGLDRKRSVCQPLFAGPALGAGPKARGCNTRSFPRVTQLSSTSLAQARLRRSSDGSVHSCWGYHGLSPHLGARHRLVLWLALILIRGSLSFLGLCRPTKDPEEAMIGTDQVACLAFELNGWLQVGMASGMMSVKRFRFSKTTSATCWLVHSWCYVEEECYLVDPASSHMLVSKIKPCMFKKLVVGLWVGSAGPPYGVHRFTRPFCRRCAPGLNWLGRASGAVTLKKLECSKQAYALYTLA
ncbi:hypothetical protein Tco_0453605 [Tanacetum coccineum]